MIENTKTLPFYLCPCLVYQKQLQKNLPYFFIDSFLRSAAIYLGLSRVPSFLLCLFVFVLTITIQDAQNL